MEFADRINILIQGTKLAQGAGALTLDDAAVAKQAIDICKYGGNLHDAVAVFDKIAQIAQKKGAYSLKDSHLIYLALEDIENSIPNYPAPETESSEQK